MQSEELPRGNEPNTQEVAGGDLFDGSSQSPGAARTRRLIAGAILADDPTVLDALDTAPGAPITTLAEFIRSQAIGERLPSETLIDERIAERTDWPKAGARDITEMIVREWSAIRGVLSDLKENEVDAASVRQEVREIARRDWFTKVLVKASGNDDVDAAVAQLRKDIDEATITTADSAVTINAGDVWDFPAIEWYVQGIIPKRGLMFYGAVPKLGKSLSVSYMCYAIVCGRRFMFGSEDFPITSDGVRILYVTEEETGSIIQARRADILRPWRMRVVPGPTDRLAFQVKGAGVDIMESAWITRLIERCRREDRRVLILDTYEAVTPSLDPKKPEQHKLVLNNLLRLAAEIDGVVIVVDHAKLPDPERKRILSHLDLSWSAAKGAKADHIVMMGGTDDPSRFEMFVGGRLATSERRFLLNRSPEKSGVEKFRYAGVYDPISAVRESREQGKENAIVGILQQAQRAPDDKDGWRTSQEIRDAIRRPKIGRNTAAEILTELLASGVIEARGSERSPNRAYRLASVQASASVQAEENSND
jgi:RecA-family ATPase